MIGNSIEVIVHESDHNLGTRVRIWLGYIGYCKSVSLRYGIQISI